MIPASCCKAWTYYAIFNAIFGPTTAFAVSPPERTIGPHATKPGGFPATPPGRDEGSGPSSDDPDLRVSSARRLRRPDRALEPGDNRTQCIVAGVYGLAAGTHGVNEVVDER
jgi:hypothetical protein